MDAPNSTCIGAMFDPGFLPSVIRALDTARDEILWADANGRLIYANRSACISLGYSLEELLAMTVSDICPDLPRHLWADHWRDLKAAGQMVLEVSQRSSSGRCTLMEVSTTYMQQDGREYACAFGRDISERKRTEAARDYAIECFTQALNGSQHILYRLNVKKGHYDYMSPAFEQITGYPVAEFSQNSLEKLKEFFHPDDRIRIFAVIDETFRMRTGATVNLDLEYRLRKADGTYCWLHDSTTACFDEQGELDCFFGSAHDITERKRAEQALQESEQRYRTLFNTMQEGFALHEIICNEAGAPVDYRFLQVNKSFERLTGLSGADLVGRTVLEIMPSTEPYWIETYGRVALTGEPVFFDHYSQELDRHFEVHAYQPLPGRFAAVFSDVTERKILQQEREKAQRLSSLGVLAGGIAHDFNNILTGVIGNISIASTMIGQEHKAAERLKECQDAARRATELTRQLLTFSRGGEPVKRAVDTERLINESISFSLLGSNVKGDFVCAPDLWRIYADAGQMNQVLNNLLINARQAMERGGSVRILADNYEIHKSGQMLLLPGRYVRIVVEDVGCGIPPSELDRIFDPYFTTKEHGTGLGLTSVYSIVRRHGGQIEVASVVGRGTIFTLTLPAFDGEAEETLNLEHEDTVVAGSGHILVMDDEEMIRDVARMMLEDCGYVVETCSDGWQAVERCAMARETGTPFDAVILDLTVPGGMGGKEAALLIRAQDKDVVLIVSSGYSNDPVMADFKSCGFNGAVSKPYDVESLTGKLARLLTVRNAMKET